jgi:hypothetical protein
LKQLNENAADLSNSIIGFESTLKSALLASMKIGILYRKGSENTFDEIQNNSMTFGFGFGLVLDLVLVSISVFVFGLGFGFGFGYRFGCIPSPLFVVGVFCLILELHHFNSEKFKQFLDVLQCNCRNEEGERVSRWMDFPGIFMAMPFLRLI